MKYVFLEEQDAIKFRDAVIAMNIPKVEGIIQKEEVVSFRPKIKIIGLPPVCEEEDLLHEINTRNGIDRLEIQIVNKFTVPAQGKRNASVNAIIAFKKIETFLETLNKNKIQCFTRSCPVYEQVPILQCVRCLRFGHNGCRETVHCKKCGEPHFTKNCKSNIAFCVNCSRFNNARPKIKVNTAHNATNHLCPSLQHHINKEMGRVTGVEYDAAAFLE